VICECVYVACDLCNPYGEHDGVGISTPGVFWGSIEEAKKNGWAERGEPGKIFCPDCLETEDELEAIP
jgi:hypothetical protein